MEMESLERRREAIRASGRQKKRHFEFATPSRTFKIRNIQCLFVQREKGTNYHHVTAGLL